MSGNENQSNCFTVFNIAYHNAIKNTKYKTCKVSYYIFTFFDLRKMVDPLNIDGE